MKIKKTEPKQNFNPIKIEIMIECESEARALYAIFNKSQNSFLLGGSHSEEIKNLIGREYYAPIGHIANGITAEQYYNK